MQSKKSSEGGNYLANKNGFNSFITLLILIASGTKSSAKKYNKREKVSPETLKGDIWVKSQYKEKLETRRGREISYLIDFLCMYRCSVAAQMSHKFPSHRRPRHQKTKQMRFLL